ncbi:MAG: NUDIX domain-containing protein [Candidatus Kaiserbacteria bacterium]|nr:NUDIX domain-containing protein [Candidatus Kaiserbacteria bacterium]
MAHIHEKIDFTASIYIVRDNTILLHRHKRLGIWLAPGGHVELDEDPTQAAIREAKEETGLDVDLVGESREYDSIYGARDLVRPRFLNRHFYDEARTHEHVDLAFLARAPKGEARHEEAGKEIRWFTKAELESGEYDIVADVRHHALVALEELAS